MISERIFPKNIPKGIHISNNPHLKPSCEIRSRIEIREFQIRDFFRHLDELKKSFTTFLKKYPKFIIINL